MANENSPLRAIKEKCIDCMGGSFTFVRGCTSTKCSLYPFRLGKNPFSKRRELTEEERVAAAERLKLAREVRLNASYDEDEEEDDDEYEY